MVGAMALRGRLAAANTEPATRWTLKQVQGDDEGDD
jgi:hypothetical protein